MTKKDMKRRGFLAAESPVQKRLKIAASRGKCGGIHLWAINLLLFPCVPCKISLNL